MSDTRASFGLLRVITLGAMLGLLGAACADSVGDDPVDLTLEIDAGRLGGPAPLTVTLNALPGGVWVPEAYHWEFGDGTPTETTTEPAVTHEFRLPGSYSVTVRGTQAGIFEITSEPITITVEDPLPMVLSPSADPSTGVVPVEATFDAGIEGGIHPYTYLWEFGDGDRSDEAAPTHTFDEPGVYTVSLSVTDSVGVQAEGSTEVAVQSGQNAVPAVANDTAATDEDTPVTVDVLANDSDPESEPLSVSAVADPPNGTAEVTEDGEVRYTPDADYHGSDSFEYTAEDASGGTANATLTVTIAPINDAPAPVDDTPEVNEDTAGELDLLANDIDVDGDDITIVAVTEPDHGTAVINEDGDRVTYTPEANYAGADTFEYTVEDPDEATTTATVNVTVVAVNDAPDAVDDTLMTAEDTPKSVAVLVNDSDIDSATLTVTGVGAAAHGTAVIDEEGESVTYTPALNYFGIDSFTYRVDDGDGGEATATVSVDVTAVNDAPDVVNDEATTNEDTEIEVMVLANDSDVESETLTVTQVTAASNGSVTIAGGGSSVIYEPDPDYNGVDSFTYTASDGTGGETVGTVTVTVDPVNDAPLITNGVDLGFDPAAPTISDDLSLAPAVATFDIDGDSVTLSYSWEGRDSEGSDDFAVIASGDGVTEVPGLTADQLTSKWTYQIVLTPNDGTVDGDAVTVGPVTIGNTPPTIDDESLTLAPSPAFTNEALALESQPTASDPDDGDVVTFNVTWQVLIGEDVWGDIDEAEETEVSEVAPLDPSYTSRDNTYRAVIRPTDGLSVGDALVTNAVDVLNSAPEVIAVDDINPSTPTTDVALVLSTEGMVGDDLDPDDVEGLIFSYQWQSAAAEDGPFSNIEGETGTSLLADLTGKNQWYRVAVTVSDGDLTSGPAYTAAVMVVNTPPALTNTPAISPTEPLTLATLLLDPTPEADDVDPEDTNLTFTYQWQRQLPEGVEFTDLNGATGPSLDSSATAKHHSYRVVITPWDDEEAGAPFTTEAVTVGNSLPAVSNTPAIDPNDPTTVTTLSLDPAAEGSDDDNDAVDFLYQWQESSEGATTGFVALDGEDSATLLSAATDRGFWYRVVITPYDDDENGAPFTTAAVEVLNTPPEVTFVPTPVAEGGEPLTTADLSINPDDVVVGDLDEDDILSVSYTWQDSTDDATWSDLPAGDVTVLDAEDTSKNVYYRVCATVGDGDAEHTLCGGSLMVINTPPVVDSIGAIAPADPRTLDELSIDLGEVVVSDDDNDETSFTLAWQSSATGDVGSYADLDPAATGNPLSDDDTVKDLWFRVCATPEDDEEPGDGLCAEGVYVLNTPPVVVSIPDISEPNPTTETDLFVDVAAIVTDDDDESDRANVTVSVDWEELRDGGDWESLGVSGDTLSADATTTDFQYRLCATPHDGFDPGETVCGNEVTIGNTAPVVSVVPNITPAEPVTTQNLEIDPTGIVITDPDPESHTLTYQWQQLNTVSFVYEDMDEETAVTLLADRTTKDETYRICVLAEDEHFATGADCSAGVLVLNSSPEFVEPLPEIAQTAPYTVDDLSLDPAPSALDPDEEMDTVVYEYQWQVSQTGEEGTFTDILAGAGGTAATLVSTATTKNAWYRVVITPTDNLNPGTPHTTDAVQVQNSLPTITNAPLITPTSPGTLSNLSIAPAPTGNDDDPEDQPPSFLYQWQVSEMGPPNLDWTDIGDATSLPLANDETRKHWWYRVGITPTDLQDNGTTYFTPPMEVVNTQAQVTSVPTPAAVVGDGDPDVPPIVTVHDLAIDLGDVTWSDPDVADGTDTVAPMVQHWAYSAAPDGVFTVLTDSASETLAEGRTIRGNFYKVCVQVDDGDDPGPHTGCSDPVEVANSTPQLTNAPQIWPPSPFTNSELTLDPAPAGSDLDEPTDTVTFLYSWEVSPTGEPGSFTPFGNSTWDSLFASETTKGNYYRVVITPTDGQANGSPHTTDAVLVYNTMPTIVDTEPDGALVCGDEANPVAVHLPEHSPDGLVVLLETDDADEEPLTHYYVERQHCGNSVSNARTPLHDKLTGIDFTAQNEVPANFIDVGRMGPSGPPIFDCRSCDDNGSHDEDECGWLMHPLDETAETARNELLYTPYWEDEEFTDGALAWNEFGSDGPYYFVAADDESYSFITPVHFYMENDDSDAPVAQAHDIGSFDEDPTGGYFTISLDQLHGFDTPSSSDDDFDYDIPGTYPTRNFDPCFVEGDHWFQIDPDSIANEVGGTAVVVVDDGDNSPIEVRFFPDADFFGDARFEYSLIDSTGLSSDLPGVVSFTVNNVPDPPFVVGFTPPVNENICLTDPASGVGIEILEDDEDGQLIAIKGDDPDGDTVQYFHIRPQHCWQGKVIGTPPHYHVGGYDEDGGTMVWFETDSDGNPVGPPLAGNPAGTSPCYCDGVGGQDPDECNFRLEPLTDSQGGTADDEFVFTPYWEDGYEEFGISQPSATFESHRFIVSDGPVLGAETLYTEVFEPDFYIHNDLSDRPVPQDDDLADEYGYMEDPSGDVFLIPVARLLGGDADEVGADYDLDIPDSPPHNWQDPCETSPQTIAFGGVGPLDGGHGSPSIELYVDPEGNEYVQFAPDEEFNSPENGNEPAGFQYQIIDSTGLTSTVWATVTFWVGAVNDAPTALGPTNVGTDEGGEVNINLWFDDIDTALQNLTVYVLDDGNPANGTLSSLATTAVLVDGVRDGFEVFGTPTAAGAGGYELSVTYTPSGTADDEFTFFVFDGDDLSSNLTVSINVNAAPVITTFGCSWEFGDCEAVVPVLGEPLCASMDFTDDGTPTTSIGIEPGTLGASGCDPTADASATVTPTAADFSITFGVDDGNLSDSASLDLALRAPSPLIDLMVGRPSAIGGWSAVSPANSYRGLMDAHFAGAEMFWLDLWMTSDDIAVGHESETIVAESGCDYGFCTSGAPAEGELLAEITYSSLNTCCNPGGWFDAAHGTTVWSSEVPYIHPFDATLTGEQDVGLVSAIVEGVGELGVDGLYILHAHGDPSTQFEILSQAFDALVAAGFGDEIATRIVFASDDLELLRFIEQGSSWLTLFVPPSYDLATHTAGLVEPDVIDGIALGSGDYGANADAVIRSGLVSVADGLAGHDELWTRISQAPATDSGASEEVFRLLSLFYQRHELVGGRKLIGQSSDPAPEDMTDWFVGERVAAGDLDGDSGGDIVVCAEAVVEGQKYGYVGVRYADGGQTVLEQAIASTTNFCVDLIVAEVTGDECDDVIFTTELSASGWVAVLDGCENLAGSSLITLDDVNTGAGTLLAGPLGASVAVADLDTDSDLDLLIGGPNLLSGGEPIPLVVAVENLQGSFSVQSRMVLLLPPLVVGPDLFLMQTGCENDYDIASQFGAELAVGRFDASRDQLLVGAPSQSIVDGSGNNVANAGAVFLWRPGGTFWSSTATTCEVLTAEPVVGLGAQSGARFGEAIAVADFPNDGQDDIAIGAPGHDVGGVSDSGAVAVVPVSFSTVPAASNAIVITETWDERKPSDEFGAILAAGELNPDYWPELVVGMPNNHGGWGSVAVLPGSRGGLVVSDNDVRVLELGAHGLSVPQAGGRFGQSVTFLALDGDGNETLLVGVPDEDCGNESGCGAVLYFDYR